MPIFFSNEDRHEYVRLVYEQSRRFGVRFLALGIHHTMRSACLRDTGGWMEEGWIHTFSVQYLELYAYFFKFFPQHADLKG
jgi:hypothetical protein